MKILYYVTSHGLGHSTRTVAIIRELKKNAQIIVRSDDPLNFLKQSLPKIKIIKGHTDFAPAMCKKNGMLFDESKTRTNLSNWIYNMSDLIKKESTIIATVKPDVIVSDVSFMPILAANANNIKSIALSSFVWNESLNISQSVQNYIKNSYSKADSVICLPLGTQMKFKKRVSVGIVARHPILSRKQVRKILKIKPSEKLVLVSLAGIDKINLKHSENIKILDLSDYSSIKKRGMKNLVEGQNLINAADLVICKCGYGFVSECLTSGVRFCYVLEPKHRESYAIHKYLQKLGLKNRVTVSSLLQNQINEEFIASYKTVKKPFDNYNVAKKITSIAK